MCNRSERSEKLGRGDGMKLGGEGLDVKRVESYEGYCVTWMV